MTKFYVKLSEENKEVAIVYWNHYSLTGKISLAIDRTSWQFGIKNLNFFVATIVYGNISIPIAWLLLDKKGNSSTNERYTCSKTT
ncbi:hypothetical protein [Rickettsia endosymbiont of Oedothorax gibbosus]|uniref:hypothetical protein n=1 Tax=Rickettsia endosymbiont of Oedothorax gibbosus TaxID=931099 RepID=UPI00202576CC|nr:hypothetical protein [Rickettsia endosymbiont of Oedothorax gibbosus]